MSNQPYQMSFFSDGSVHHEGPGQPSPMLGIIAQAMTKMLAKKKKGRRKRQGRLRLGLGPVKLMMVLVSLMKVKLCHFQPTQ